MCAIRGHLGEGPADARRVIAADAGSLEGELAICAVTLAELHFGVLIAKEQPGRAQRLRRLLVFNARSTRCPSSAEVAVSYAATAHALGAGRTRAIPMASGVSMTCSPSSPFDVPWSGAGPGVPDDYARPDGLQFDARGLMVRGAEPESRRSHTVAELRGQRAAADRKATVRYALLALPAAGLSGVWSLLFPMAGDACKAASCHADLILGLAYLITWGGIVGGLTLAVVGCSGRRRPPTRYWSMAGLALIVATCLGGVFTANSLIPG